MLVALCWRELEFCDESIELVDYKNGLEPVEPCLAEDGDGLREL